MKSNHGSIMNSKILSRSKALLGDDDNTLQAALRAALSAVTKGGISTRHIDCIVCVSSAFRPSHFTAANVKKHLALFSTECALHDITSTTRALPTVFSSFAESIENGVYQNVLILHADGSSMRLNWNLADIQPLTGEAVFAFLLGDGHASRKKNLFREEKMEVCS